MRLVLIRHITSPSLRSIRFAPPLVIEEADLRKAIKLIEECLNELDELDHIPGDEGQEHGTVIGLED
jgi:ornithine--oxo-acid transaminase